VPARVPRWFAYPPMPGASNSPSEHQTQADPWFALMQVGAQLVAALTAPDRDGRAPHPWVERDPATGARSLKVPLPSAETSGRLSDTLSLLAEALRGKQAGK
jgi:hypothetical protein